MFLDVGIGQCQQCPDERRLYVRIGSERRLCGPCTIREEAANLIGGRPVEFMVQVRRRNSDNERRRRSRTRLVKAGLCVSCWRRPANAKAHRCDICYAKHLENCRRWRRANGRAS